MTGDITQQPLARAVLRHMAAARGSDDPLGSFSRAVLNGVASLQAAAKHGWYADGLAKALRTAQDEQNRMTLEQRHEYQQAAERLRTDVDQEDDSQP